MSPTIAITMTVVVCALLALIIRYDSLLLKDLAETRDEDLRLLTRKGWAVAIVATFPLGPLMYVMYAKGPRGYV